jgi:hypothetical protein
VRQTATFVWPSHGDDDDDGGGGGGGTHDDTIMTMIKTMIMTILNDRTRRHQLFGLKTMYGFSYRFILSIRSVVFLLERR